MPATVDLIDLVTLDPLAGTLSFDRSDFTFLSAGQSAVYNVAFDVQSGPDVVRRTMALTIAGANEAPVITGGGITGSGETATQLALVGELTFTDADLADTHTVSARPSADGMLGTMSAVLRPAQALDGPAPTIVDFGYVVDTARIAPLAQGESRTESFDVAVADGRGGVASRNVSFALVGENDAPTIVDLGTTVPGALAERADGVDGENSGNLTDSGVIVFDDVDLTDTHTVAATLVSATGPGGPVTARGALTPRLSTAASGPGAGEVTWDYSVSAADLDALGDRETVIQIYSVAVTDRFGATANRNVTVTLTGASDLEPRTAVALQADEDTVETGTLPVEFGAARETLAYRLESGPANGVVAINPEGAFTYTPGDEYSGADSFSYRVEGGGRVATGRVDITVRPVNDAPALTTGGAITVAEGGTVALARANLDTADRDNAPETLVYTVTGENGFAALASAPGEPITQFTQAQLDAGAIVFRHDGSRSTDANLSVSLSDGAAEPGPGEPHLHGHPRRSAADRRGHQFGHDRRGHALGGGRHRGAGPGRRAPALRAEGRRAADPRPGELRRGGRHIHLYARRRPQRRRPFHDRRDRRRRLHGRAGGRRHGRTGQRRADRRRAARSRALDRRG